MKNTKKILIPVIALAALLVSACNAPATLTPTVDLSQVNTAVAQTLTAQAALSTATPRPTKTATVTRTPAVTATSQVQETPVPPTSIVQNYCDNSLYIADVTIPDNTELAPGQAFDKTWTIKNVGTCTWTEGYTIIFSNGDLMNGNTRPVGQTVAPQQQVNVTVKLIAPNTPGSYAGYWRLANGKGAPFGQIVSVVIKVVSGATTSPETVTPTPTATTQAASTATTTATATGTTP